MSDPDFFLASTEGYGLDEPRRCWRIKRLAMEGRRDLLLIRIEPPLIGQKYDLGVDLDTVVVATRHREASLFPIQQWPVYVHVARPLVDHPELRDTLLPEELASIAWAELYRTEEDARAKPV